MCNAPRRSSGDEVKSAGRAILGSRCLSERATSHRDRDQIFKCVAVDITLRPLWRWYASLSSTINDHSVHISDRPDEEKDWSRLDVPSRNSRSR